MKRQVHLYLHTHWDREWYRSFEGFRFRLCKVLNQILDDLETHPQHRFLLDGQTIVLDDYLALYPQDRERLESLIQTQALSIGPWYVLPDEFLVSGEAIIRNLHLGTRQARALGQRQFIGYLPDMFGHLAQMPQLLSQSELSPAVIWRGVSPQRSLFHWQALDGSGVDCLHLTQGYYQDAFHDPDARNEKLGPFLEGIDAATPPELPMLLPVGGDHLGLPPQLENQIEAVSADFPYQFVLSDLPSYLNEVADSGLTRETIAGELHQCETSYVLPGVWSSRVYLKQANDHLQTQLERQLEPLLAWAWLQGMSHPTPALIQAWKYLLQNQPHDSICGCSTDEVHQDMLPRFRWTETLIDDMRTDTARHWLKQSLTDHPGRYLNLLNFSPAPWRGCLRTTLEFPADQAPPSFRLLTQTGDQVPFELLDIEDTEKFVSEPDILPHWESVRRFQCLIPLMLSPQSISSLQIQPHPAPPPAAPMRHSTDPCSIENRWCKVVIDTKTGQLKIYKQVDHSWQRAVEGHLFVDSGDAGDSYNYSPPRSDQTFPIAFLESQVEKHSLAETLHITYQGTLPAGLHPSRESRSKRQVPCTIETRIRLYANDPTLYFRTTVDNQAKDHRLRLLLQSPYPLLRTWGSTAFGALERHPNPPRPIDVPKGKERPVDTFPFQDWIHLTTVEEQGFLWLSSGLHEASLIAWDHKPTLAVTLLRAVGWLSRDDLRTRGGGAGPRMATPEAQCLGEHTFDYALSLCGNRREDALERIHHWQFQPQVFQGTQPVDGDLFTISPETITLTALKKCLDDNALLLRCVNLHEETVTLAIEPHFACKSIFLTDPLERSQSKQELTLANKRVEIACAPHQILSFKFYPLQTDRKK